MSNTSIQLKKSGVTGNTPVDLSHGELALNYADGKLYYKDVGGDIKFINNQNTFETVIADGNIIFASGTTDTLAITSGEGISLDVDTYSKIININSYEAVSAAAAANVAFDQANAAFAFANSLTGGTSSDGIAREMANSAGSYANSAFTKANTATNDAAGASLYANGAFIAANTADSKALSAGSYANSAFGSANTADSKAVTSGNYANSAYTQANTATSDASSASSYANSAFLVANTADSKAVTAGEYANLAFGVANTAVSDAAGASLYANAAFNKANTADSKAVTAGSYANSAYTQANTATNDASGASTYANGAFLQANAVFAQSNTTTLRTTGAFAHANNAYDAANVGYTFVNSGGTINGSVTITNDLTISGNIVIGGNSTSISSNNLTLTDTLIYLGDGNAANLSDIGIIGAYTDIDGYHHMGLIRDAHDGVWKLFSNVASEPSGTVVDLTGARYDTLQLGGLQVGGDADIGTTLFVGSAEGTPLGGATNPIIGALGSSNGYIQNYTFNTANGTSSSADIVVYPNNGTDAYGWLDMGITSNNYSDAVFSVTGRNEGYVFMSAPFGSGTSGNLVVATDSTGIHNAVEVFIGGFDQGKDSPVLVIDSTKVKTDKPIVFSDNTSQNTAAAPFAYANAAFLHANAAFETINLSSSGSITDIYNTANASFDKANAAYQLANTATATFTTRSFSASGGTDYIVTDGVTADNIIVTQNGLLQTPNTDYTVSGTTLSFVVAPASGENIQIRELGYGVIASTPSTTIGKAIAMSIVFGG